MIKLLMKNQIGRVGNAFVSGVGDLKFKFRAGKIDTVLPTVRHRCDISSKGAVLTGAMTRRWALKTRYTLQRNTERTMKGLI